MIKIQTLSSGSGGNITYVSDGMTNILIDVGLPLPAAVKRLRSAGIKPDDISAILITHEHNDHICGVGDFIKKYGTKIFTHKKARRTLQRYTNATDDGMEEFDAPFNIGDIAVKFFPVPHDSELCLGYTFTSGTAVVGIATDIGKMTEVIISHLSGCQIVVLESNHDNGKLSANTKYPPWLKRRVAGTLGHLSNMECGYTIAELCRHNTEQVILAHLSEQNNSPNLAYTAVKEFLRSRNIHEGRDIFIDVALQNQIGNLYTID